MTELRHQFPQLQRQIYNQPLVYLDSAATALKPQVVISAIENFYRADVSNVHRGAHYLGDQATSQYEGVREKVKKFINAKSLDEVVFVRGTTEGVNLLAYSIGEKFLKTGDEILLTEMEHHSNIVPWQLMAERKGCTIKAVKITDAGEIDREDLRRQMTSKVKLLSFTFISNVLGTINPVKEIVAEAQAKNIITVVDAAQAAAYGLIDVQSIGCDFLVFSGHKMFAPNGVGVVYGRRDIFAELPPYQSGGSMISTVSFAGTKFLDIPHRFEAGTPAVGDVIGLGAAIDFLSSLDLKACFAHEMSLVGQLFKFLQSEKKVRIVGTSENRVPVVSLVVEGTHPSDMAQILDQQGIAVRAGHHCCEPLMKRLGIPGTLRVALSLYNSSEDVERFIAGFSKAQRMLL